MVTLVGITGGIGSGKSIITRVFNTLGYPVFYSDSEAKLLMHHNRDVKNEIIKLLGEKAYLDNQLNKPYIANKIFNSPDLKDKINQIVHPKVRERFQQYKTKHPNQIIFNEAAILFETGAYKSFDFTICVVAHKAIRIKRITKRDGLPSKKIEERMNNQWSDKEKTKLSDFIIHNNDEDRILPQVFDILKSIMHIRNFTP